MICLLSIPTLIYHLPLKSHPSHQPPTDRPPQCFLTVPALIYQTAISTFPRTRKFANPYAFVAVDASFLILWLSAAIAVGTWVNDGIVAGQKKEKSKDAGCETFGYGSVEKCDLSQVQVGLAAMIWWVLPYHVGGIAPHNSLGKARDWVLVRRHYSCHTTTNALPLAVSLLFLATTALSRYTTIHFHRHGTIPSARRADISHPIPINHKTHSPDFDPNPHHAFDHDDSDDEELVHHFRSHPTAPSDLLYTEENEVARLAPTVLDHHIPRRPLSWEGRGQESYDTAYTGAGGAGRGLGQGKRGDPFAGSYAGAGGDPFSDDVGLVYEQGGYAAGGRRGETKRVEFPEADYYR